MHDSTEQLAEEATPRSSDVFRLLPRVWPFIKPYRRHLLRLALAILPAAILGLLGLWILRIFVDVVGNGHPLKPADGWLLHLQLSASRELVLRRLCLEAAMLALAAMPAAGIIFGYAIWILQRISNLFRVTLYSRLQEQSLGFHTDHKIGDAIFRMFQDSAAIPQVINGLLIQPIRWLPFAVAQLIWLAWFNYSIALIALGLLPIDIALAKIFSDPMRRAFNRARQSAAQATSRIEETLAAIKAVKAFGQEKRESQVYARENWEAFVAARHARMLFVTYRVVASIIRGAAHVCVLYIGARQVLTGGRGGLAGAALSLGLYQATLIAFDRMTKNTTYLTDLWGDLQDVAAGLSRVFAMLDRAPEHQVLSGTRSPGNITSGLLFDDVTFSYDGNEPVLSGARLEAKVGEITALLGPSGAGKSTIIALLLRFFDPTSGAIRLDSEDARDFELAAYRGLFAVALQDNPLFTQTMRDNLSYGRPAASDQEIALAIRRAGLESFVETLPAGLQTMLGEKGAKLSTGQAQRIGLARALLRDSPILLLDEPTSALDVATEQKVMAGIREWLAERPSQRLIVMTTHRGGAAAQADRVFRIEQGRIMDSDRPAFEALSSDEVQEA